MNNKQVRFHRLMNRFQVLLLFLAMAALLGITGGIIAGMPGVKFALIAAFISWLFTPSLSSSFVMRLYRAQPMPARRFPELYHISNVLAQRANLNRAPDLYLLPGRSMTAFAAGSKSDPAICLGQRLIQTLNAKEIAGILGHEISHIKNNDIMVMGYASIFNRIIYYVSMVGQIGLLLFIPFIWLYGLNVSVFAVMIMASAPAISLILNQALSRSREYEADLGSAMLTGNPDYLSAALTKLEIYKRNMTRWFKIPMAADQPNWLLSTHPPTKERIRRLQSYGSKNQHFLWA